jgi:hypothetical protein
MIWFSLDIQAEAESSRSLTLAIYALIVAGFASILFMPISLYAIQTVGWIDIIVHIIVLATAHACLRRHCNERTVRSRWSFAGPSMYFGWISAATVIRSALMRQLWSCGF